MEGLAFTMGSSGGFSGSEQRLEPRSNSNSTGISSSRGNHGDGVEGTARTEKKRKARSENWSEELTHQLLDAWLKFEKHASTSKGRRRMGEPPKWESISRSVNGMTAKECRRRSDTLTKSFNRIKRHCDVHQKQFRELTEVDFIKLELPTRMEENWYFQMSKIKALPKRAIRVSHPGSGDQSISSSPAPAAVMAEAPHDHTIREMVGTREPARAALDPPRSTSPTDLQSHSGAEPGLPPLPDSPCHSHQHVNRVEQCITTAADSAEPPHLPPVDLRNDRTATVDAAYVPSQTDFWRPQGFNDQPPQHPSHQVVQDTGHDLDAPVTDSFDHTFPDVESPFDFDKYLSDESEDYEVRLWEDPL